MVESGLFITLYDEDTLQLYLDKGIYGQHMNPEAEGEDPHWTHYRILGDYGCAREGKHVFFFRERNVYYGGQIQGSDSHGAFFLNGQHSSLGREADAPLVWDESQRDDYDGVEGDDSGLFTVDDDDGEGDAVCQPFLIRFEDERDIAGNYVSSDDLYFELGKHPYPLPSNSMSGMGFCTLTPGETEDLLTLLEDADEKLTPSSEEDIEFDEEAAVPYSPEFGVSHPSQANPESHLEASVLANPSLLPEQVQPSDDAALCRQVPISPFKPSNMDKADVCYFGEESINDGTIPETVIELKTGKAGVGAARQVNRYLNWLYKVLDDDAEDVTLYVFAEDFTQNTFDDKVEEGGYSDQVQKVTFDGVVQETL